MNSSKYTSITSNLTESYDRRAARGFFGLRGNLYARSVIFKLFIENELSGLNPQVPGVVVDLGCNGGDKTYSLLRQFPDRKILGIDIHNASLEKAKDRHGNNRVEFRPGDARRLGDTVREEVGIIFASQIFHHLQENERKEVLHACAGVLSQKGVLIISDTFIESGSMIGRIGRNLYMKIATSDAYHTIPWKQMSQEVQSIGCFTQTQVHHLLPRTARITGVYPSSLLAFQKTES